MPQDLDLQIRYEDTDDGQVVARVVGVPAAMSFGSSREEAREAVLDALRELALSYLEEPASESEKQGSDVVRIRAQLA